MPSGRYDLMKLAHLLAGLRDHGAERLYEYIMKEPLP